MTFACRKTSRQQRPSWVLKAEQELTLRMRGKDVSRGGQVYAKVTVRCRNVFVSQMSEQCEKQKKIEAR